MNLTPKTPAELKPIKGGSMLRRREIRGNEYEPLIRVAGLHDMGKKATVDFQRRLEGDRNIHDHHGAGFLTHGRIGRALSFIICGHHGGLPIKGDLC